MTICGKQRKILKRSEANPRDLWPAVALSTLPANWSKRRQAVRAYCESASGKSAVGRTTALDHHGGIGLLGTLPSQEVMEDCDTLLIVGSSFPYIEFLPEPGQAVPCKSISIRSALVCDIQSKSDWWAIAAARSKSFFRSCEQMKREASSNKQAGDEGLEKRNDAQAAATRYR